MFLKYASGVCVWKTLYYLLTKQGCTQYIKKTNQTKQTQNSISVVLKFHGGEYDQEKKKLLGGVRGAIKKRLRRLNCQYM